MNKTRADDHVRLILKNRPDEVFYIARIMLSVSVHLHGDIVMVFKSISKAGLYGTADPQIYGERDIGNIRLLNAILGVVGRTVIDHQDVRLTSLFQVADQWPYAVRLIVRGYDDESPQSGMGTYLLGRVAFPPIKPGIEATLHEQMIFPAAGGCQEQAHGCQRNMNMSYFNLRPRWPSSTCRPIGCFHDGSTAGTGSG